LTGLQHHLIIRLDILGVLRASSEHRPMAPDNRLAQAVTRSVD
jgi:hypothetical protein